LTPSKDIPLKNLMNTLLEGISIPVSSRKVRKSQTQYSEAQRVSDKQQLIIGLDFGTAFTKVVIRETSVAYAISFDEFSDSQNPYLLPGIFSIDEQKYCSLGKRDNPAEVIDNLKMRLLEKQPDSGGVDDCLVECAAFLALVIQHARYRFMEDEYATYKSKTLDWIVNVGIPTENFQNQVFLERYHKLVYAAWVVSISSDTLNMKWITNIVSDVFKSPLPNHAASDQLIHPEKIGVFPEFAAQMTGYVKSPRRQSDLHILFDIGAGTTDLCIFNVTEDYDERQYKFPIFAQSVKHYGVNFLILHRIEKSNYRGNWQLSPHEKIPPNQIFASKIGMSIKELNALDEPFRVKVQGQVVAKLNYVRAQRYPKSPKWKEGIPLFLCGGGKKAEFYSRLFGDMQDKPNPHPISVKSLPHPINLEAKQMPKDSYDRISVAYGLSFDPLDISSLVKEDQVENISLERPTYPPGQCPQCNGTGKHGMCSACGGSGWISN